MNHFYRQTCSLADWFEGFCLVGGTKLRGYQKEVGQRITELVKDRSGGSVVVMHPRQTGKNELQAYVEAFLMLRYSTEGGEIVKVSPTWRPQSLNAMRRLERVLSTHPWTITWEKEQDFIYRLGKARIYFLSGAVSSNIVGATANLLLEVDEAQDVQIAKFDKDIAPMAASTNAARVFWGTAWTSKTLLARELRAAQAAQDLDGQRRVFRITAENVGREVPAYADFVAEQVAKLGRNHVMVKTQFFSEEIDAGGGMFPAWRADLMQGEHTAGDHPLAGRVYAALLDVAGEDEGGTGIDEGAETARASTGLSSSRRDSTALTIVEVDRSGVSDPVVKGPIYRVQQRREWVGIRHSTLYGEIKALAQHWKVRWLVVDATGIGAGLASFLDRALPGRVLPFVFNQATKSKLGWTWLGVIDSGRWKEAKELSANFTNEREFSSNKIWQQLSYCEYEILPGPGKWMRWGVPDGRRDVSTGELVHDDLVLSSALCGVLEEQGWGVSGPALVVKPAGDPLKELDRGF